MSERFDNNLIVEIKVSYSLVALLTAVHLGGAILVGLVPLGWLSRSGLWTLLLASAVHAIRLHGLRTAPQAGVGLELDSEGLCSVRRGRDGTWQAASIVRSLVLPWLVMLVLKLEGRRRRASLVIPADAVEPEAFRRLRARLRLQIRAA